MYELQDPLQCVGRQRSGGQEEPHRSIASVCRSPWWCQWGLESHGEALLEGRAHRHHWLHRRVHRAARRENALSPSLNLLCLLQQDLHGCDAVLKCVSVALYIPLMIAETLTRIATANEMCDYICCTISIHIHTCTYIFYTELH